MRIMLRQFLIALITCFIFAACILLATFLTFPLKDWSVLWEAKLYNISYLMVIGILLLFIALIIGIYSSQLWRQHIQYTERQMERLLHNQILLDESYKDLQKIESYLQALQDKNEKQVEHAQRLATERANEREKSLQEVVIQERNRLARDLHDSVSQQLFAASMMMSAITETSEIEDATLLHQIAMVEKMIHQSQLEMRALLLHLRPIALKGKSLQDGINDLLQELMDRIPIKLDANIEKFPIEKGVEDQLFRILQEAISNSLRHAEASLINVTLIRRESFIIFKIIDNGKGFDMSEINTSSYGLETMKERTHDLGGQFKLVTLPKNGTRIDIKIPTKWKAGEDN